MQKNTNNVMLMPAVTALFCFIFPALLLANHSAYLPDKQVVCAFEAVCDSARQEQHIPQHSPKDAGTIILNDLSIALSDAGAYYTAPLRFQAKDWIVAGGFIGGTLGLMTFDEVLNQRMLDFTKSSNRTPTTDAFAEAGRLYGEILLGGGIGGGLYLAGLAAGNADVRITGRLTLEALAFSGVLNITMKALFGRSRPFLEQGAFVFQPVQFTDAQTALPSGHTTVAFAVSSVLAERIGNPWIGAGLYALASLTAASRMYHTKHWASDVLLGGAIGAGAGLLVTHLERERMKSVSAGNSVFVYPTLNGLGLTLLLNPPPR